MRLRTLVLGYLAACLTASLIQWLGPALGGIVFLLLSAHPGDQYTGGAIGVLAIYSATSTVVLTLFALVPSLILLAVAERHDFRSVWGYALGGAAVGLLIGEFRLNWNLQLSDATLKHLIVGMISGCVYWLIAVRPRSKS